jgi:hypothetical protein
MRIRTILAVAAAAMAPLAAVSFATAAQAASPPSSSAVATPVLSHGHATVTRTRATVAWKCTATSTFKVTILGPGKLNGRTAVVRTPKAVYAGLESGHHYEVRIQPQVNGKAAGKSGVVSFMTKK